MIFVIKHVFSFANYIDLTFYGLKKGLTNFWSSATSIELRGFKASKKYLKNVKVGFLFVRHTLIKFFKIFLTRL